MILFPYKKVVIETRLSPKEIHYNIKRALYKTNWMRFDEPETYDNVIEYLDLDKFKFETTHIGRKKPTKRYVFVGNIMKENNFTKVHLTIRSSYLDYFFGLIISLMLSYAFLGLILLSNHTLLFSIIVLSISIIIIVLSKKRYKKHINYIQSEFLNLLSGKIVTK